MGTARGKAEGLGQLMGRDVPRSSFFSQSEGATLPQHRAMTRATGAEQCTT